MAGRTQLAARDLLRRSLSPELLGVIRVSTSFNIVAGLSYDHVVSAGSDTTDTYGSSSGGTNSQTTSHDASGTFSSISLWFGMGGYL